MKKNVDQDARAKKNRAEGRYKDLAVSIRGYYLYDTAVLDTQLAEILTEYFCKDDYRKDLFFSEIATGQQLSFRVKIELLTKILRKYYHGYLDKNPDLLKTFNRIKDFRNQLAHATIDISEEALNKEKFNGVGFVTYRNGEKVLDFITIIEFENRLGEINNMIHDTITDIRRLLSNSYPSESKKVNA